MRPEGGQAYEGGRGIKRKINFIHSLWWCLPADRVGLEELAIASSGLSVDILVSVPADNLLDHLSVSPDQSKGI